MWLLKIQDPSGETRKIPLRGRLASNLLLGRGETANVLLRDPTVPQEAAMLWPGPQVGRGGSERSPYWLRILSDTPFGKLGDLPVKEAQVPAYLPMTLGETVLTLVPENEIQDLPQQPSGVRPWLTQAESGKKVLWMTKKAAGTQLSTYLAGETGTGKEVLARLLHLWSPRASGPFIPLHCGALPLSLAESELFGHVKGAFTGASHHRPGALLQAHGGTLFLDEIGDLSPDIQVKLLRFLENGEIRSVGADHSSRADVRIVCATHHSLKKLVEEGKFRRDLYYRLASITIEIPTLRARPEDIELLSNQFATEMKRTLSSDAHLRLQAYSWPGNVRELRHAVERASGLASPFSPLLNQSDFDFLLNSDAVSESPELELGAPVLTIDEMERILLLKALKIAKGNRTKSAKILGVARSTLFEMLKRHKIKGPKAED